MQIKKQFGIVLLILLGMMAGFPLKGFAFEQAVEQKFNEAGNHYFNQEYQQALDLYKEIESFGLYNGDLFYNIANCYYQLNEIGNSILYYRKALLYDADDEDILNNLAMAREKVTIQIPKHKIPVFFQYLFFPYFKMNMNLLTILSIIFFTLTFLSLSIFYLKMKQKSLWKFLAMGAAVLGIIFGVALSIQYNDFVRTQYGVVIPDSITVYTGPGMNFEKSGDLVSGVEFEVVDLLREEWYQIKLNNGTKGFVYAQDIGIINE